MTSSIGPTRAELDAAEELGVEGHDDGRDAHQDGGHRRGHGDAGPAQGSSGDGMSAAAANRFATLIATADR
jgi:hypothetical protein